jgi:DNA polymerase-1
MLINCDKIIMHNAKFDIQKLCRLGIPLSVFVDKFEDTQALAHLIDEHQSTSLKYLARTVLGEETDEEEVLKVWRRQNKIKKEEGYEPIPHEILAPYALKDSEFTLRLYKVLWDRMPKDLQPLYEIEKALTLSLLGIEARGMKIDRQYVTNKRKEYSDRIYKLKHRIGTLAGEEFNPQSPKQIIEVFAQRGVRVTATDKATLSALDDELALAIVELREANKIKSTYFDGLYEESKDGILHPNFRQHGTKTGRMSSGAAVA